MTSARMLLRAATAQAHDRVDAAFGAADLSTRAGYAAFLSAQARAHLPVEAALDAAGAADIVSDWAARRRAHLLTADLADLGARTGATLVPPSFATGSAILGGIYVLEGSRLGGTLLRRSVGDGLPTRFLGTAASGAWRELVELLDLRLVSDDNRREAIRAAIAVFELFERAGDYL